MRVFVQPYKQAIIAGDFNDWGKVFSKHNDLEESPWDDYLNEDNVTLLNDGSITRIQSGRALDVTIGVNIPKFD